MSTSPDVDPSRPAVPAVPTVPAGSADPPAPLIRPRTDADLAGCVAALAQVQRVDRYPVDWPPDPSRFLTPSGLHTALVAVDPADASGQVLGHLALTVPDPDLARAAGLPAHRLLAVSRLFTAPAGRRRGTAALLLERAERVAAEAGRRAVLEVDTAARAATALYRRAGWLPRGTAPGGWTRADGSAAEVLRLVAPERSRGGSAPPVG